MEKDAVTDGIHMFINGILETEGYKTQQALYLVTDQPSIEP